MKRVLVVDDSETVRTQVARALTDAGLEVTLASDGIEGLREAQQSDFSLILLDISMPRMGGMELLDRLKSSPRTQSTPVLILTTEMQESIIQKARKAGAAGWIIKPVKMPLLVEAIQKVIESGTND